MSTSIQSMGRVKRAVRFIEAGNPLSKLSQHFNLTAQEESQVISILKVRTFKPLGSKTEPYWTGDNPIELPKYTYREVSAEYKEKKPPV